MTIYSTRSPRSQDSLVPFTSISSSMKPNMSEPQRQAVPKKADTDPLDPANIGPLRYGSRCRRQRLFTFIEDMLEMLGLWEEAQEIRIRLELRRPLDLPLMRWQEDVIRLDIRIREIVQRETFLLEECPTLQSEKLQHEHGGDLTSQGGETERLLQSRKKELEYLNKEYWILERRFFELESRCNDSPLRRAYRSHRSRPFWYLIPWLRADCAGRGGCCGRDCGCCERSRSTFRGMRFGHCTVACGCCQRHRGFEVDITDTDSEEYQKLSHPFFRIGPSFISAADSRAFYGSFPPPDTYSMGLYCAYILGVKCSASPIAGCCVLE